MPISLYIFLLPNSCSKSLETLMMYSLSMKMDEVISFSQRNYDILVLATFSLALSFFVSKALRNGGKITSTSRESIPGRLGLPFVGETFSFLSACNGTAGCYDFVRTRRLRYGKWFKTKLFGKVHVFVPTTEGAKQIFTKEFTGFTKGYLKGMADAVGRKSVFCVSHESHKRVRRLLSDPFSMGSLRSYVHKTDRIMSQRLKDLDATGKSFSVIDFGLKVTFDSMCNMMVSITDEKKLREMDMDVATLTQCMLAVPLMVPGTKYYKGMKARQRLLAIFRGIIERRRNGEESHDDFLQSMVERSSFPASEKLDDEELVDNLLTMLVAGQGTTAATMMWCVKFLDENRDVQDSLREEQLEISKNKKDDSWLSLEDVYSMTYGWKVVKETLRMANPVLWFPRRALEDCTIGGHEIKKGWNVAIDATHIHFDPDLYKDPTKFNPLRFDEIQPPYSFIPFASGARTCLGMSMARVTLLVFLHRLTSGYRWTVDDLDPSLDKKDFIPKLKSGCPITLEAIR